MVKTVFQLEITDESRIIISPLLPPIQNHILGLLSGEWRRQLRGLRQERSGFLWEEAAMAAWELLLHRLLWFIRRCQLRELPQESSGFLWEEGDTAL